MTMLKRILAVLTALVILAAAAGSAPAESAETVSPGGLTLRDIESLNGGPVSIHEDNNGRITFIGGTCTAGPVKSWEDAKAVTDAALPLLGGNRYTSFEPWRVLNDTAGNVYYVFRQVLEDTLVPGGAVKIITDRDGRMIGLTGSVVPVPAESADGAAGVPAVTAEQAEALVLSHERESGRGEPDVVKGRTVKVVLPVERVPDIEADMIDSRYVWSVYTTNPSSGTSGTGLPYLAHYVTLGGEYLYSLPTIIPGDAAGSSGYDASYVFEFMEPAEYRGYVDFSDGTERLISVTLMRDTRTGMYYLGNIEHRIVVADCWEFLYNGGHVVLEYSPDNLEWDQTGLLSLYQYCRAWDYFSAVGWKGADGKETPIIILKDFCDSEHNPVNNAAYAGEFYGWQTFLSSSVNDLAQCLDVGAHEFSHGVTGTMMTYNSYVNDFGAINEAVSDIHGNLCEMMAEATDDTSWLLGESSLDTVRSMSDPHRFGQPEYVWDVYYRGEVRDPTEANDYGGVHGNSSLLNRVAYLLCAEGGMSLEDARSYWFAADCAMVPGSDYSQLRNLLPWVMKITGLGSFLGALESAMDATRLGETLIPAAIGEEKALLVLNLPDNEVFSNGKWLLQFVSINVEKARAFISNLLNDLAGGSLDGYPKLIRNMFASVPGPDAAASPETRPGFPEALLAAIGDMLSGDEEQASVPEPAEDDPDLAELKEWLRGILQDILHMDMGNAGADGHCIRVMSRPGWTVPVLAYMSVDSGGAVIEQLKYLVFLNGRWYDPTAVLYDVTNPDFGKIVSALFESGLPDGILELLAGIGNPADILKALALDVKGGTTVEIPAEGLEKIDLNAGIMNISFTDSEKPDARKSRPALP